MTHEQYIQNLFNHIESKGYSIDFECEGEEITKDEALTQVDEFHIYATDSNGVSVGWIFCTKWNDWDETIVDHTVDFGELIDIDDFIEDQNNLKEQDNDS